MLEHLLAQSRAHSSLLHSRRSLSKMFLLKSKFMLSWWREVGAAEFAELPRATSSTMTAMSTQIRSLPMLLPSTKFWSSQTSSFEHLTERLFSKHLLTIGQSASDNTVEKLKKLLKMELKNAIEENPNLDKDVFPDESISFVIDGTLKDKLLPSGQLKKFNPRRAVKAWRGKKSLMDNPPSLWSEENIATWMNDIMDE